MKNRVMTIAAALLVSAAPAYVAFQAQANDMAVEAIAETPAEVVEVVEHTLADGTKIHVKGQEVTVVDEDGNETPAPDGQHELEDGTTVETMGGMIVTGEEPEAVEGEMEDHMGHE